MSTVLFQCDHIPAGNARDAFFCIVETTTRLKRRDNMGTWRMWGDQLGRDISAFAEFGTAAIFGKWD